ncbi:MAG: hypothetical protein CM1200mP18_04570 [Gammaproteobacteria bacterium]|nr:MAG: hypothetical protein CM1200mP18_04570 [Gammaproteobacteria bacterium]
MNLETVNYQHDGGVAIIKLNRPQAGNSLLLNWQMTYLQRQRCKGGITTYGRLCFLQREIFSASAATSKSSKHLGGNPKKLKPIADQLPEAMSIFLTMPKPVIVAVMERLRGPGPISLVGDIIIVDETAGFG